MDHQRNLLRGFVGLLRGLALSILLVVLLPLIAIVLSVYFAAGALLYLAVWCWWCSSGRNTLLVYSNSPIWREHIEQTLLPRLEGRAVVLNWSERRNWRPSLAVWAFRYFGGSRAYNPLAIVFRPFRLARTFRFYEPFRDFKHGKSERVAKMTEELLASIDSRGPGAGS